MNNATFGLRTPQDLLAKLERELTRLKTAREVADMIDHGINFALSAWHMVEWIAEDDNYRDKLRAKLGTGTADKKTLRKELEKFALRRCRELESCRVVATCAKHLECTHPPPRDKTFEAHEGPTTITWRNDRDEVVTFVNKSGQAVSWINFCIVQNGVRLQTAEIFTRTLEWWRSFVYT